MVLSFKSLLAKYGKNFSEKYPFLSNNQISGFIDKFLKFDRINDIVKRGEDKDFIEFIDFIFDDVEFTYYTSLKDKLRIPSEGRLILVSNHPLGGLDALALIRAVAEVREDVKILANKVLLNLKQLEKCFIPVDVFNKTATKDMYLNIHNALQNEEVIIIFPAGEVSRLKGNLVLDGKWSSTPIKLSLKYNTSILPVFIEARNSMFFYLVSILNKNLATLFLTRELFNKKSENVVLNIGNPIPHTSFKSIEKISQATKLLRKHTYKLNKQKSGIFKTDKNVIHPVSNKLIKYELQYSELIKQINSDLKLYLLNYENSPKTIKEISRLREVTYRKVGEGTGETYDKDYYDKICNHLVLWNENQLDIVGSYRLGDLKEIIEKYGVEKIYNSQLFDFNSDMKLILSNSLELGRSFIQEKYWRTNALDQLWQGIGDFITKNSHIKYLFGAVSISDNYPRFAKDLIISYYSKWYQNEDIKNLTTPHYPYFVQENDKKNIEIIFSGESQTEDFLILKKELSKFGLSVPILLRKYVDICDYGGVSFLSFGIDSSFNDSIDALVLMDLSKVKSSFKERYLSKINIYS